ncbi:hypothetical protein CK203_110190 [Vitis vinifera]|uniref:Retrotransposon gag domain-containing protein n=1 Tax=Vitis vinifera TaxID=29760 RepID=A0A438FHM1_VITVI|nr:hypothetical protein CK203_110190 [Vitis vinifera]
MRKEANKTIGGCVQTPCPNVFCRCPHLPGAVRQPEETKAISNGAKPWKGNSCKANDKCKPFSRKQRDLKKKMRCYAFRFRPRDLLTTNDREAKERILGLTQSQCILELQGSSLICAMRNLGNDPCPRIMLHKMKAHTLLVSHQRDSVIKDLSCQTQCERGSISKRLDDMLSTPFSSRIIHYDLPRGFLVPKFSAYDGSSDPFDHIIHYRQLMTLDIGNDALLCKVFPASLQGQALSWFHRLPPNSVDNFRDLSKAFVGQYLCSAWHKQNISTLQNIKMQKNESLREFVKRFGQVVLQVEAYNMDVVLQIFKRSICPGTLFFESLAKKPPTTMDDLFQRASKYSMLEDDVRTATQQILVVERLARNDGERSFKPLNQPRPFGRRWPGPIRADPSKRDHSKKCAYHKEHGHTMEQCRSLHYLVERLIKVRHLKQYVRSKARVGDTSRSRDSGTSRALVAPEP